MAAARYWHTANLLTDGRVLILGGIDNKGNLLAAAELYDPKIGRFSPTGGMSVACQTYAAAALSDGGVFVAGGRTSSSFLASAELYDQASGTFSPTGSMTVPRWGPSATLLSDGDVLVVGGVSNFSGGGDLLASAELYDPTSGTFSPTGSMSAPRVGNTATLLSDGSVLIAGGEDDNHNAMATAELYQP